jgi:hypothetical protein
MTIVKSGGLIEIVSTEEFKSEMKLFVFHGYFIRPGDRV